MSYFSFLLNHKKPLNVNYIWIKNTNCFTETFVCYSWEIILNSFFDNCSYYQKLLSHVLRPGSTKFGPKNKNSAQKKM